MNQIKHVFILTVDFIGILIIISIVLFTLNYFRVLPLSTTFPKYFGFLPQVSIKKAVIIPTPTPTPPSGIIWDNQAGLDLISNYSDYFKTHSASDSAATGAHGVIENSVFIGYNDNFIQVLTPQGTLILKITANTQFNKFSPPTTTKQNTDIDAERLTVSYKSANDFFSDAPFGSFLQITYQPIPDANPEALTVNYYPEHKY